MTEYETHMRKMDQESVDLLVQTKRRVFEAFPDFDALTASFAFAKYLLEHYLGCEWVDQMVKPYLLKQAPSAFWATASSRSSIPLARLVTLADHLFNLRHAEGFKERCDELRGMDVEGCNAELYAARFLMDQGLRIRFRQSTGHRGEDYDFQAVTPDDGTPIAVESKCRLIETRLDEDALFSTLNRARRQLPKGIPSMILVRLPEFWMLDLRSEPCVLWALEKLFRQTDRIGAVIIHAETFVHSGEHTAQRNVYWGDVNLRAAYPPALLH
jgi:hypothetical protein